LKPEREPPLDLLFSNISVHHPEITTRHLQQHASRQKGGMPLHARQPFDIS
jgi:hypothetical protein